jgi:hypothetical protein
MFIGRKKGLVLFATVFMFCIIYPIPAQQENKKITIVPAGYRIIGQTGSNDEKHINNLLETILSKQEFFPFMTLATISPDDLNRIRREIGQPAYRFEQRFDYTVYGDITVNSRQYRISTVLIHNITTQRISWYDPNVSSIESAIEDHALKMVDFLKNIQLDVTIDSIKKAAQDGNIEAALMRIDIYRYKYGDSTELQDIELSLRKQSPDARPIANTRTIDILRRADALIDAALAANSTKGGDQYYQQSAELLNTLREDEKAEYRDTINGIQGKIEKYANRVREFNTGGIGLAYFRPVMLNDIFSGRSPQDYYPDIFALSLTWFIPRSELDKLFNQPYIRFTYLGFNNHTIQKAAYLEDAAIYGLSLFVGFQINWMLEKYILPYVFLGGGYTHFIEYASDGTSEAFLTFGQINYQAGLGLKLHIPTVNLILSADAGADFGTGSPMTISLNYSFGLTYLFYGKKRTF